MVAAEAKHVAINNRLDRNDGKEVNVLIVVVAEMLVMVSDSLNGGCSGSKVAYRTSSRLLGLKKAEGREAALRGGKEGAESSHLQNVLAFRQGSFKNKVVQSW